jgi:hypothetical protein
MKHKSAHEPDAPVMSAAEVRDDAQRVKVSSISRSRTLDEMAEFWDAHSLADYDDQTQEVEMTFDPAARRTAVNIEPELMADISRVARECQISAQTLINVWLRQDIDRLAEAHISPPLIR